ncbi:hypothetical protein JTB14_001292, partial [Gonioctena quinquepunctata]
CLLVLLEVFVIGLLASAMSSLSDNKSENSDPGFASDAVVYLNHEVGVGYLNQDGKKFTNGENSFDVNINYPAASGYSQIEPPRTVVTTSPKSTTRRIRTAYTPEQLVELENSSLQQIFVSSTENSALTSTRLDRTPTQDLVPEPQDENEEGGD